MKLGYTEKELRRFTTLTKVLLVVLGVMFLVLSSVYPFMLIFSAGSFFLAYKYKAKNRSVAPTSKNQTYSDEEVKDYTQSLVGFPERDEKGMEILKILDDVRLSGVTREHEGLNPQDTIKQLSEGEEIYFKRVNMKNYPNATLVIDVSGSPIGWIPEDFAYQEDIAKRLDDGTTVKAKVSRILGGSGGKSYGIRIGIARYTKKRISKP